MNWFRRHLNLALIIGAVTLLVVQYSFGFLLATYAPWWTILVSMSCIWVVYGGLYIWVLERKGYKFSGGWCILWLFTGAIAVIVLLLKENKKDDMS